LVQDGGVGLGAAQLPAGDARFKFARVSQLLRLPARVEFALGAAPLSRAAGFA
jgi:hypothetical protein